MELLRELDDTWMSGIVLCHLGIVAHDRGALDHAVSYYEQGLDRLHETGDVVSQAMFLDNQGHALLHLGDVAAAQLKFEDSLAIRARMEDPWGLASAHEGLGLVALAHGNTDAAAIRFRESLARYRELDADEGLIWAVEGLARVAEAQAHYAQAARMLGAAQAARQQRGIPLPAPEQAEYQRLEDRLRTRLTELHYISITTVGRSLTLEQIAEEAYGGSM